MRMYKITMAALLIPLMGTGGCLQSIPPVAPIITDLGDDKVIIKIERPTVYHKWPEVDTVKTMANNACGQYDKQAVPIEGSGECLKETSIHTCEEAQVIFVCKSK